MQLLEHQAKTLLARSGITTPSGITASAVSDVTLSDLEYPVVIKSQVPIGGRGKLGGVRLVHTVDDFSTAFLEVKALKIKGYTPETLLVEQALDINRELYLALRLNRDARRIDVIVSPHGGVEIESQMSSVMTDAYDDLDYDAFSTALGMDQQRFKELVKALYSCMTTNDLLLLEVNPLVVTRDDALVAADAKCLLDDNALFRHPDYANQAVSSSVLPLGGTIGVIANGAGMAMSTMDTIYAAGGKPANFLDIGGGTGEDVFIKNLREITTLPGVTSIIINIFAGITRCDDIARGIIAAKANIPDLVPLYIRLEGTRHAEAKELLEQAGIVLQPDLSSCVKEALKYSPASGDANRGSAQDVFSSDEKNHGAERAAGPEERERTNDTHLAYREANINHLLTNEPTIVQGITGHHGSFHTGGMLEAGTNVVAGVTPGKGGQKVGAIPVYDTVKEAVSAHQATTSVIFVPPAFAKSAMVEAIEAGIMLIVCITEGIPVHDMLYVHLLAHERGVTVVGPNCPGLIIPGSHKLGIIAAHITTPGHVAIISRSGTLTYELADALTKKGIGQRIVLGIGGDPVQGMNFTEALALCEADPLVERIIMVGEIGGTSEQLAADYIEKHVSKPVFGLVVGHSLPAGQQFGHAGAIVGGLGESAKEKTDYLRSRGILTYETLDELIMYIPGTHT